MNFTCRDICDGNLHAKGAAFLERKCIPFQHGAFFKEGDFSLPDAHFIQKRQAVCAEKQYAFKANTSFQICMFICISEVHTLKEAVCLQDVLQKAKDIIQIHAYINARFLPSDKKETFLDCSIILKKQFQSTDLLDICMQSLQHSLNKKSFHTQQLACHYKEISGILRKKIVFIPYRQFLWLVLVFKKEEHLV